MQFTKVVTPLKKLSVKRMKAALTIAVMNHKGGCGKTSIVDAFAHVLLKMGFRVLIIDTDPQCNLSMRLGIMDFDDYDIKRVNELYSAILKDNYMSKLEELPINITYPESKMRQNRFDTTPLGVLGVIPGSPDCEIYAASAKKLRTGGAAVERLQNMINFYKQYYDFILIDTAPSIHDNALNEMTVAVADKMVVPFDGSEAILGLGLFMRWLKYTDTEQKHSPLFVLSKYQADTKDIRLALTGNGDKQFEEEERSTVFRAMKKHLGPHVCAHGIQELRVLRSHTFIGMTKAQQRPYVKLVKELLHKMSMPRENSLSYWQKKDIQTCLMKEMEALECGRQRNVPMSLNSYHFRSDRLEEEL